MATEARLQSATPDKSHWPEQQVSVIGKTGRIRGNLSHEIRYCCTAADLQSYWKDRYNWMTAQLNLVDNIGTKAAASKLCAATAWRIKKLRCEWLPVNSREARSDLDRLAGCSACSRTGLVMETVDHLFQYRASSRQRAIREIFSTFHDKFRETKTSKLLISALQTGATAWVGGTEIPEVESLGLPTQCSVG